MIKDDDTGIFLQQGVEVDYVETDDELLITDDEHKVISIEARDIPKLIAFLEHIQNEYREGLDK